MKSEEEVPSTSRSHIRAAETRRRPCSALLVAAAMVALGFAAPARSPAADGVRVIVHPGVAGGKIPKAVVAQIFLRQVPKWGDGSPIEPVDHSLTSPLRLAFAREVLGMSALELHQYWTHAVAAGTLPPPVKDSDKETIAYVASHPGAIGYVAAGTTVPGTVKILLIE
jgi:ABC-type phosphate transport system substrate-binding protein